MAKKTTVKVPAEVAALLATHAKRGKKKPLHYLAPVRGFDGDLEVRFDPEGAARQLADDEAELGAAMLPIGFFVDLPLLVDTGKKALPVAVMMEGRPWSVAKTFAAFAKQLGEPPAPVAGPKKGEQLLEPATIHGYRQPWRKCAYAAFYQWPSVNPKGLYPELSPPNRNPFLWIDIKGKNLDLYYRDIHYGKSVAARWQSRTERYDRGTGQFLDVAWYNGSLSYGATGNPVVTPRVRALLETLPMTGVEFLPTRVSIDGAKADYFVVHPTTLVPVDRKQVRFKTEYGNEHLTNLAFKKLPADLHLFRVAERPDVIVASGAVIELFRPLALSGPDFLPIEKWKRD